MTHHYISRLTTAGTLAVMLSSAHTPLYDQDEVRSPGRTLPRLAAALRCYRAADASDDLNERLRLQRNLADAIDAAAMVLLHDASPRAEDARRAVAHIRLGMLGGESNLDLGTAMLDAVLKGETPPPARGLANLADADTPSLLELMVLNIDALHVAIAEADAATALATQAELLNDARLLELMFRHAPTDTARRVRFALDELRVGLAGDQARLDFATAAFGRLAHEEASA